MENKPGLSLEAALQAQTYAEQLAEDRAFLSGYVRDALLDQLVAIEPHVEALEKLTSIARYDLGETIPDSLQGITELLRKEIYKLVEQAAQDLNEQLFVTQLLKVYIVAGDEVFEVEQVLRVESRVIPIVNGSLYEAPYSDVIIV